MNYLKLNQFVIFLFFGIGLIQAQTPNWLWAHGAKGSGHESVIDAISDKNGNVYLTGEFYSSNFTIGSFSLAKIGLVDFFIAKYNSSGNVVWANSVGAANNYSSGISITSDNAGNIFVTGTFSSATITFGTTTITNSKEGSDDIFIVKYDSNGNVVWAKGAGGTDNEVCYDISTDASGNIYAIGYFESTSFNIGSIVLTSDIYADEDAFIAKYDKNGNEIWAKSISGNSHDIGTNIKIDANGNVLIAGHFQSSSLYP